MKETREQRVLPRGAWQPPEEGWVKLNVDGAFSSYLGVNACGCLVRNENGVFMMGFIQFINEEDELSAEIWACIHGLKIAWDIGCRRVILETDSIKAIELIMSTLNEDHADCGIVREVQKLLEREWDVRISYIDRNCNMAADYLAKIGLNVVNGFHLVPSAPPGLMSILSQDSNHGLSISWHTT